MDEKKLWMKISGSINYYLRYYDKRMSDEELLEDYVEYVLGGENGMYFILNLCAKFSLKSQPSIMVNMENGFYDSFSHFFVSFIR